MGAFSVEPEVLASAGSSIARAAAEAGTVAAVVRETLSALGAASAHTGISSAAEVAGGRWHGAVQAWALGGDGLGAALVDAAASYAQVDAAQMQGGPQE